jgi:hypothetical protein
LFSLALMTPLALAKFVGPQLAPVEILARNAAIYVEAHPEDANGWYVLGRIHYLAFAKGVSELGISQGRGEPGMEAPQLYPGPGESSQSYAIQAEAERRALKKLGLRAKPQNAEGQGKVMKDTSAIYQELIAAKWAPAPQPMEQSAAHAKKALESFPKAIAMAPDNALYQLGLASLQEQYTERRAEFETAGVADLPVAANKKSIAEAYLKAFTLAKETDAGARWKPMRGLSSMVSYEAGQAYLKLAPKGEKVAEVKAHLEKINALPRGPITPIVFSSSAASPASINDLLEPAARVRFDLSGFGGPGEWPWVKPDTCLLVWDPDGAGIIRDGRQLFGSYTWGIFWQDGFRALAMLDDNHDGVLSGGELTGLASWTDRNSNGVSDVGEVRPLLQTGVRSITTEATGTEGIHPHHPAGLKFDDGSTRAVWDWITRSS